MVSTTAEHLVVVDKYLEAEVSSKRIARIGPPEVAEQMRIHCSLSGVINKKKNKHDKWHLILDLSSPEGHSVNEGVSKELCS